MTVRLALLSVVLFGAVLCSANVAAGGEDKPSPLAKQGREEIDKLIGQLKSNKFKDREEATRQLMERDDALPALREAAKSDDAEVASRARKAMEAINKRLAKRAFRRAAGLLKKGQTDQFVEQAVRWREYVDEDWWKAAVDHVHAINDEAVKASGGQFKLAKNLPQVKPTLPWVDIAKLRFVHTDHLKTEKGHFVKRERIVAESVTVPDGFIHESFIFCDGSVESKFNLAYAVVFANGNMRIGNPESLGSIGGCIVICDGNVTTEGVDDSVILCTGNVSVGTDVRNSVIVSGGYVKMGLTFPGSSAKNSLIQEHQCDPLHCIHFFDPTQVGIEVKSTKEGVRVEALAAARSFAKAGIRKGDQIVAVDGVEIHSAEAFRRLLRRRMQETDSILLEIRREGKPLRIEVGGVGETP